MVARSIMSVVAGLGGEAAAGPLMDYADATVDRDPTGYPLAVTEAAVHRFDAIASSLVDEHRIEPDPGRVVLRKAPADTD